MEKRIVLTEAMAQNPYAEIKSIWKSFADGTLEFGSTHVLRGACFTVRKANAGALLFIELLDGSTVKTLQCVCDSSPDLPEDPRHGVDWKPLFEHASRGATFEFTGIITKSPAHGQPIEFVVQSFQLLGSIADTENYPLGQRGYLSRDFLRTIPHQRHHTQLFLCIQIIKQYAYFAFHEQMKNLGIGEVQPTIITSNECEEGAHPFTVTTLLGQNRSQVPVVQEPNSTSETDSIDYSKDFFGRKVFLTVSSQLHLEATVLGTKRDGYCMTPAFRAEPSTGPLHLAEFLMPEWELIGGGLERNMAVAQSVMQYVFKVVLENCRDELEFLDEYRKKDDVKQHEAKMAEVKAKKALIKKKALSKQEWADMKKAVDAEFEQRSKRPSIVERLEKYVANPFVVSSHEECVRILLEHMEQGKVTFDETPGFGDDFSKQHEFYLTEVVFGGLPVFVRYFPKHIKAFYMPIVDAESPNSIKHVDCYDLLFPFVGEVVGGSQRIHELEHLTSRMDEMSMDKAALQWYIDLRKDASLPHGGAGLGFGRMMIVICGITNIKDFQEFPRAFGLACFA